MADAEGIAEIAKKVLQASGLRRVSCRANG
jgi:hypothetical protein